MTVSRFSIRRAISTIVACCSLAIVACAARADAQWLGPPLPGYSHSLWTTQHGLPQNTIRALIAGRDGYLWIGTGNGLVRFDGITFQPIATPGLASTWIAALHQDSEGALWIGTDIGIARYLDGVLTHYALGATQERYLVVSIQADRTGRLWIATDRQIFRRDEDRFTPILPAEVKDVTGFVVDRQDMVWIGTGQGLLWWRDGSLTTLTSRDGLPADAIGGLYEDRSGTIWAGTRLGVARVDRRTGKAERASGPLATAPVERFFEDHDGTLWLAAHNQLFMRASDGQVSRGMVADAGAGMLVAAMIEDREGHLWFGVSGGRGGLHRLSPHVVSMVGHEQGLPCDNVVSLATTRDGAVWTTMLCGDRSGLFVIREGAARRVTDSRLPAPMFAASLLPTPEGGLWVGTFTGQIYYVEDGRVARAYTQADGLAGPSVIALARDAHGALWIGTDRGLNRLEDGRWTTWRQADGLVDDDVRCLTIDDNGGVWIGTRAGVSRYANGRFTNLTRAQGLPPAAVRAIHLDAEDAVWLGTYGGGLCRVKGVSRLGTAQARVTCFGTQDDLLDSSVHRILADDRDRLWMSGDRGIRSASRRELNALADGVSTGLSVVLYDERDGMRNAEANGMGQPSGWKMSDGSLWFPTQGGIAGINPARAGRDPLPPPSAIDAVLINGQPYDPRREITAPPGSTELEVRYTAPAPARPEQVQFRYRLDGLDSAWIEAGARRVAHFANLAPGSYRFEVKARSGTGVWSQKPAALALVVRPRVHQQPLVRAAMVLGLMTLGYAAFRLRVARLQRRAQALEGAITRRVAEIHVQREELSVANRQLGEANGELSAAKQALEASHGHLLAMFDQLRVGVVVVDSRGEVRFASQATSRLLAGDDENVVGRLLDDVLPVAPEVLDEVRTHLFVSRQGTRLTVRLDAPSGKRYWTEIEARVDPRNERHRILYLYDVTEAYEVSRADDDGTAKGAIAGLIGQSSGIRLVHSQIGTVAAVDATVLIEGETGTGKELVARSIHEASRRRLRPFVAVNCAGLTESLLASQLFGHKRGAFTGAVTDHVGLFEAAQGGTLLLDEIGDMPMSMQTHLLRVLQEREIVRLGESRARPIDARVLAATHRSLDQEVAGGRFREDLLYRIRGARILLPALRQRTEDIPALADVFLEQFATAHGKSLKGISRETMQRLMSHRWPGNVRELKSTIEWAVIRAAGPVVKLSDLPQEVAVDGLPPARAPMQESERRLLIETLRRTGGNRSVAARLLGVSRATLYRRLAALEEALPNPSEVSTSPD